MVFPKKSHADWVGLAASELARYDLAELVKARIVPDGDRFMPVITYPPVTMYSPAEPETVFQADPAPAEGPYAAYVHIPFCRSQCLYCHWIKLIAPPENEVEDYLDTLLMDMDLVTRRIGAGRIPITSALFGGGTPTYLSLRQMDRVLKCFTEHFDLGPCRQFSYEAEPYSICGKDGLEKLKLLKSYGVNRISLGVQSFEDRVLSFMGRIHTGSQALEAIEQIHKAGIESVSIDLIYGYYGQTLEDWRRTMQTGLSSGAEAVHLYRLRIQRHGDMQGGIVEQYDQEPDRFPSPRDIMLMKAMGLVMSEENGWGQHFTRIFSVGPEHVTQFMADYCVRLTNVAGVGISAWSNHHRTFTQNIGGDFGKYRRMVREGKLPIDRGLVRDLETEARRSLILPLKNDRVYKKAFKERTGLDLDDHFGPELARLKGFGLLEFDDNAVWLTRRGRFLADEVVQQLFQKKYLYFPELANSLMPD